MRSIYAGLGLVGSGAETVEQLGKKLAKQAAISEKEGERIARKIQLQSTKAAQTVQHLMEQESARVVNAVKAATKELTKPTPKPAKRAHRAKRKASRSSK